MTSWLITGGAGFIGSCFVRQLIESGEKIIVLDALTYAGNRDNLPEDGFTFIHGDICDGALVSGLLPEYQITHLVNFAAESHVDNSIDDSAEFIRTNITGTHQLLTAFEAYRKTTETPCRFIQVSTDEVYGSLGEGDAPFTEETPLAPNSPYSASKASADMLVRAWHETYGLDTIITRCSNNYGPRQHHEKLIPTMIRAALAGQALPVYGDGKNIRDWIHVEDHAHGIYLAAAKGNSGEIYNLGGRSERRNIEIVAAICEHLDQTHPLSDERSYQGQVSYVTDRLGHDWRYAIDDSKAQDALGFSRRHRFDEALKETVEWYCGQEK